MNSSITAHSAAIAESSGHVKTGNGLYLGMSILLLLIVLTGFAPTFFMRGLFDPPPISPYVYMHGTFMTAWYVLFVVQASLAYTKRIRVHREIGSVAATIGYVAMLTAAFATWNTLASPNPAQDFSDPANLAVRATIIWGSIGNIAVFTTLLTLAVCFRRNAHIHKRMMLFASISFISPAVGRIAGWPIAGGVDLALFNNSVILLLILGVLGYELWSDRRIHLVSVVAGVGILVVRHAFLVSIPGLPAAVEFVRPVT